jgi:hypothetical protein
MKLLKIDRDDIVSWIIDTYDNILEESKQHTFQSFGFNCAGFEIDNKEMKNITIIKDFEEESYN